MCSGSRVAGLIATYPFMKRITWWPQLFLGLDFNWGALLGWTAVDRKLGLAALLLYLGGIFWTIGYDTIYAHRTRRTSPLIGVKSRPWRSGAHPAVAVAFYAAAIVLWGAAGHAAGLGIRVLGRARRRGGAARLAGGAGRHRRPRRLPRQVPLQPDGRLADVRRRSSPDISPDAWIPICSSAAIPRSPRRRWCRRSALHLASEITPIWQATEERLARGGVPPPFWAFAWAGGQALARYLLDHPEVVAGRWVLDSAPARASSRSPRRKPARRASSPPRSIRSPPPRSPSMPR